MSDRYDEFERRLADELQAYADEVDTRVDPYAVADRAASRARRPWPRSWVGVAAGVAVLVGAVGIGLTFGGLREGWVAAQPTQTGQPTPVERAGTATIDVAWENRSQQDLVLTVAEDGALTAYALVEPCTAHNMIVDVTPPFTVGLGPRSEPVTEPQSTIFDSGLAETQSHELLVQIERDGSVSVGARSSEADFRSLDDCGPMQLLQPGDSAELPLIDDEGQWGTVRVERGSDVGGYPDVDLAPETFAVEFLVTYDASRPSAVEFFGAPDWILRPTDPAAVHFFLREPARLAGENGQPAGPQPPLGIYPGGVDYTTATEGWIVFEVPRREANLELELVYLPGERRGTVAALTVRQPGPPPEPIRPTPGPGAPIYVEREGSPITVLASPEADALFENRDTCTNPQAGFTIEFPDDWYTNTEIGDVPACSWFTPELFEVTDPDQVPNEIWLTVEVIDGAIGYIGTTITYVNEVVRIDGLSGRRGEFNQNPNGNPDHRTYHYVVPLGLGSEERTLVATTSTDSADDYDLARAVLDRLMASLDFGQ